MENYNINTKNICLLLGVLFGVLINYNYLYYIPCTLLLLISGIQSFEISKKMKKSHIELLNHKLKSYEDTINMFINEQNKLKTEIDSIKSKMGVSQMFGQK